MFESVSLWVEDTSELLWVDDLAEDTCHDYMDPEDEENYEFCGEEEFKIESEMVVRTTT